MTQRIAIVGAYGSGKTLLAKALSEVTGLPYTQGTAMREPIGGEGKHIWNWTEGELLQLTVKRFAERTLNEAAHPAGFISDGSMIHEWVFAKLRLVTGPTPGTLASVDSRYRSEVTAAYENVADNIGKLAVRHAKTAYDVLFHLPIEFPMSEENPPINENFRALSDEVLLPALEETGVPVHTVSGTPAMRLEKILKITGLPTVVDIDKALEAVQGK
ncbi:AAA family ATPase [Streptomyces antimicrobicus]|uniref:ATP-binding protein n=1 Tax=Streptomyces antimicrobicus TaxID=2883108 RepID=A0ABS8B8P8_9ACTN|nr:AAA family ATPase [Streptomyces antimicrobicus]MCB5180967.1 ATP-binding protein [Streptomyces antimicrobicus]